MDYVTTITVVTLCSPREYCWGQCFRGTCCVHLKCYRHTLLPWKRWGGSSFLQKHWCLLILPQRSVVLMLTIVRIWSHKKKHFICTFHWRLGLPWKVILT